MAKWTPSPNFLPGNTEMGSDLEDSHQLTGSVTISGSLAVNGVNITGGGGGGGGSPGGVENSVQVNDGAGGFEGNSNLKYIPGGGGADALRLTGSVQMTGSIELSGTIHQTGSINLWYDGAGPAFPDIAIVPANADGGFTAASITIGALSNGAPPGNEASVINYGSLSCSHGITASSFVGDGSGLTNLPGGGGGSPGGSQYDVQVNDGAGGFAGDAGLIYEDLSSGGDPGTLYFPTASTYDADHTIKAWDGSGGGSARNINVIMADDAGSNALFYKNSSGAQVALIDSLGNISGSTIYGDGSNLTNLPGGGGSPVGPADSVQFKSGSAFSGSSGLLVRYPGGSQPEWADLVVSGSVFCQRLYGVEDGQGVLTRYQDGLGPSIDVQEELITLGTEYGSEDGSLRLGYSIEHYANEPTASHYQGAFSARTFYSAIDALGSAENGSVTISAQNSNVHRTVYDGAMQLTMSAMTPGASYVLFLSNSVGAAAVTYDPATFKFPGGTVPTNTQVAGKVDIISGISDGSQFYCDMTKNFS